MKIRFSAQVDANRIGSAKVEAIRANQKPDQFRFESGDLLVVCDGRIAGSATVAEVIASAWRQWGTDCPQYLYGDYAFFIHDRSSGDSFCARDHIGSRPFFYVDDKEQFACASDIPTLLDLPGVSHELDEILIAASQLERYFEPDDGTFYRAIRRLPAGHCLHRTQAGTRIWRWWRPEALAVRDDVSDADAVAETRRLLEDAIADRLRGAGRVAVHLSGGIDSSLVAALVAARAKIEHAYCWQDLAETGLDEPEAQWIEAMRAQLGLSMTSPKLSAQQMADLIARDWACHPDARNLLHEAAVQGAAAKAGVATIFSGWGGDEGISFHGRGHKPWLFATGRWHQLWRIAEKPGLRGGLAEYYSAIVRLARDFRPRLWRRRKAIERSLLDPAFARRVQRRDEPQFREFGARATQIQLLQTILAIRMEDWAISGAEQGIEYVYPLLDRALLEYVVTLPPRMFVRRGGRRWLVREVSRGLVPELIRTNVSKNEVVRGRQVGVSQGQAFVEIARRIDALDKLPARARYFDMVKLRARLAQAEQSGTGFDKVLRSAIQLLNLGGVSGLKS